MWGDDKSLIRVPRLRCDRCGRDALIFQRYSGLHLCGDHFQANLEARARRTIRAHGWIRSGDRIAVAFSGGRSSSSLLHFLSAHFGLRRDLSLVAITVDEDNGSCRDTARIARIAEGMGIEWAGTSFAEEFGGTPDGILASGGGGLPCDRCTWLRDQALTSLAKRVGATRLALGTNLDDEARSVFLHVLRGEASRLIRRAQPGEGMISWIRPLLRIPEEDLSLYARLNVPDSLGDGCPHTRNLAEREAGRILDEYTSRHPSTPFSLVNLGEALSAGEGTGSGKRDRDWRSGEPSVPARPARDRDDPVTGRG